MKTSEILENIFPSVGGKENVSSFSEKGTILYIYVKDRSMVHPDALKQLSDVESVELMRGHLKITLAEQIESEEIMAKIDYEKLASDIVRLVGGEQNIGMVTHCVTRLRFSLKDRTKAQDDAIRALPGVLGVVYGMDQYQVILGENLFPVFDTIEKSYDIKTGDIVNENHEEDLKIKNQKNKTFKYYFSKAVNFMAQSLTPFITILYGAGMLRVILSLSSYFNSSAADSTTYKLFNFVAQTPFYFMPVLVAYGASRVLKSNPAFSMTLALSLLYPDFNALVSAGDPITMLGMPVKLISYSSTLLPAIFLALLAAWLEKFFYKHIPAVLRSVFAPLCILLVGYPITILFLGPAGNVVGGWIVNLIVWIESHTAGLAPGIIAAAHPFLVLFGVNMLMVPPMTELFTAQGYDNVFRPGWILHNIAEGGSCFAVMLKTKDGDLKSTALSAGIGAVVSGVSEPALYGIGIRFKTPIIGVSIGGLVGGAIAGIMGAKAYSMGYSSILGVVIFEDTILAIVIACIVSFVVSFLITYALFKDDPKAAKN